MKKIIAMLLALLMLVSLMTACGAKKEDAPAADAPAADAPAEAPAEDILDTDLGSAPVSPEAEDAPEASTARTDLVLATTVPMDGCDPHFNTSTANGTAINLVYETLVLVDQQVNVTPLLCEKYDILEEGLVYEYKLKQGVKFHNGEEMKASDVVYSFTRAQQAPGMYANVALIESIEAVDEYTVRIKLIQPYAPFYHLVGNVAIVSEKAATEAGDAFATEPCGTGAFTISDWTAEKVVFTRFEDYHGEAPKLETITVSTVSDAATALMAFEAGDLDYIGVPNSDVERLTNTGLYNMVMVASNNTTYITFNNQVAPFDDVRVRQAIAYAINKEEILLGACEGYGYIAETIGNPDYTLGLPDVEDVVTYEQNLETAKQLLAEAGYADGLDLGKMMVMSGVDEYSLTAEILKSQLEAVGITFEVQLCEPSSFVADAITGNYGIAIMGVTLGIDMAEHEMAYVTAGIDQLNLPRFSNERVDELFGLAMVETDQAKRDEYYAEVVNIVAEQAAIVPLSYSVSVIAADPALIFDPNLPVRTWYWAAE